MRMKGASPAYRVDHTQSDTEGHAGKLGANSELCLTLKIQLSDMDTLSTRKDGKNI